MTGLEFFEITDKTEIQDILVLITTQLLHAGYKNIPDWISLSAAIEALIRKHGWSDMDIEEIALKAAIALGIKKKNDFNADLILN